MSSSTSSSTYIFEQAPIPKAVMTLAIPTIITQLINIVYNFADTWYVGRTNNPAMVAALSVCMPVFIIMAGLANLFGIGGSSVISRLLGMKQTARARKVFAFSIYGGLLISILYAVAIFLLRPTLIPLVGGDASSYDYIYDYMFWTMIIGAIPTVGNVLCGHLVRSIGAAKEAGFGMSLGGVLNIILDPLFMFVLLPKGHEVTGAAIATLLSNTAALLYFLIFLFRHRDNPVFTLNPKDISFEDNIPAEVLLVGFPASLQTIMAMVSGIFANALVSGYGSAAVAGMGVANKINTLSFNTTMGLTHGILPLVGYNYGAKNYHRMKKSIVFTAVVGFSFCILCTILFRGFSGPLVSFFITEPASLEFGSTFLKVIAIAGPLCAFCFLMITVFQASGWRAYAFWLSIMRKGLLDIPTMFLFRSMIGAVGVVWATPFAEIITSIVAILMFRRYLKKLGAA